MEQAERERAVEHQIALERDERMVQAHMGRGYTGWVWEFITVSQAADWEFFDRPTARGPRRLDGEMAPEGWRVRCDCGWESTRPLQASAHCDLRAHRDWHAGTPSASHRHEAGRPEETLERHLARAFGLRRGSTPPLTEE